MGLYFFKSNIHRFIKGIHLTLHMFPPARVIMVANILYHTISRLKIHSGSSMFLIIPLRNGKIIEKYASVRQMSTCIHFVTNVPKLRLGLR